LSHGFVTYDYTVAVTLYTEIGLIHYSVYTRSPTVKHTVTGMYSTIHIPVYKNAKKLHITK